MTSPGTSVKNTLANPFPPAAVANYAARGGVSIPTAASLQAKETVSDYLSPSESCGPKGRTIAIVGDFGTGKTHLALEMLHELDVATAGECTLLYVDVPGDSFLNLYRDRFLTQIERTELRKRVVEYYADVVADELADSELTSMTAAAVRTGKLSPETVVDQYALAATRLSARLSERLGEVTHQPEFASALTLFLRPEYEAAVWQWLSTGSPDVALVERGVTKTIASDVDALEAMGVITLLYGQRGHRFALVIDELEKILVPLAEIDGGQAVLLGLKRLMEICSHTGALLILCGLPDYFDLLPEDTRQRVTLVIRPTRLTGEDTRNFIEASHRQLGAKADLAPFSADTATYIASIAAGNPRRIIRLCYLLYRAATDRGVPVTRALVREIAKEHYETFSSEEVVAELVRLFDRQGWRFERDKQLFKIKGGRVDIWLPSGDAGSGCVVLLASSVLDQPEAKRIVGRATQIEAHSANDQEIRSFLVVNGRVADEAMATLSSSSIRVFEFDDDRFVENFGSALAGTFQQMERAGQNLSLTQVLERLDQLGRQVTSLSRGFDMVFANFGRSSLETAAEAGLRRLFASIGETTGNRRLQEVPVIATLFEEAEAAIGYVRTILFDPRAQLSSPPNPAASLDYLSRTVRRFADDIADYLEGARGDVRFPSVGRRDELGQICSNYDRSVAEFMDLRWPELEASVLNVEGSPSGVLSIVQESSRLLARRVYDRIRDLNY